MSRDPNTLRAQYGKNNRRCYLATIANYWYLTVCSEAVQSAILATAWLLVSSFPYLSYKVKSQNLARRPLF